VIPKAPEASSLAVRSVMRANRKRDTAPEMRLRRWLHARGLRYRVASALRVGDLLVRPDLVFPKPRVAVFVDGCFWHGCPDHGTQPRRNSDYWGPKLASNLARDARVDGALAGAGWHVVRVWEHECADDAGYRVRDALALTANMEPPLQDQPASS
jgi:DNA mismatch endonuclease, patch repair protein